MTKTRLALVGLVAAIAIRGIGWLLIGHDTPALAEKSAARQAAQEIKTASANSAKRLPDEAPALVAMSQADYVNILRQRQARIRDQMDNKDVVEQIALRREIALVQLRLDDAQNAYYRYRQLVADIEEQLKQYRDSIDANAWQGMKDGFLHGNSKPAYDVLASLSAGAVTEQPQLSLVDLAKTKYLLGRISEDADLEERAYQFYKQAAGLDPDSVRYLLATGTSANRIALYNNAIQFLEAGREIQQKASQQSELYADILRRLASAYEGKNQNQRARRYRRQALQIYINVLGRQHVKTVALAQLMKSKK